MEKFCVFCGNRPKRKSMEHVIPKWLIKMTGAPERKINVGIDFNKKDFPLRTFAFDSLRLPSCASCNYSHSTTELLGKNVIHKMINMEPIAYYELHAFLNWLDKIRIGLWLAFNYLDKNVMDIRPHFFITDRIGGEDRFVFIYRMTDITDGVNFNGTNVPAFQIVPSCFTLRINGLLFFNVSYNFIISRRIGFPYPSSMVMHEGDKVGFVMEEARKRIMLPLIKWPYNNNCVEIYQPIFRNKISSEKLLKAYDNEYVRNNCMDYKNGYGSIFISNGNSIARYPREPSVDWIPENNTYKLRDELAIQTFEFQNYLLGMVSIDAADEKIKKYEKARFAIARRVNNILISRTKKDLGS